MKCEGWTRTPRTMCAATCADSKYSVATASSAATLMLFLLQLLYIVDNNAS